MKKKVWANRVNLGGLYSKTPLPVYWDSDLKSYWDSEGDLDVKGSVSKFTVIRHNCYCVTVASPDKKDIEIWAQGAQHALFIVRGMTHSIV